MDAFTRIGISKEGETRDIETTKDGRVKNTARERGSTDWKKKVKGSLDKSPPPHREAAEVITTRESVTVGRRNCL